jgi:hypothetical protein
MIEQGTVSYKETADAADKVSIFAGMVWFALDLERISTEARGLDNGGYPDWFVAACYAVARHVAEDQKK